MKYIFAVTRKTGSPSVSVTICPSRAVAFNILDDAIKTTAPQTGNLWTHADGNFTGLICADGTRYEVQPYSDEALCEYMAYTNEKELVVDEYSQDLIDALGLLMYGMDVLPFATRDLTEFAARVNVPARPKWDGVSPIPMILHCPNCGRQHIDRDESKDGRCGKITNEYEVALFGVANVACEKSREHKGRCGQVAEPWKNPPHRSHKCTECNHVWRPCDFETVGVQHIKTVGKMDSINNTMGPPSAIPLNWTHK